MAIPVSLADAKRQLRIEQDDTSQDDEVNRFIARAAGWVERYTGHILVARDVTLQLARFGDQLKAWPIKPDAAVTVSYGPVGGTLTSIAGVGVDIASRPARLRLPNALAYWPGLAFRDRVSATVRAGYEVGDPVPSDFATAMLVLIGAYDGDREGGEMFAQSEKSAKSLCRDYRLRSL